MRAMLWLSGSLVFSTVVSGIVAAQVILISPNPAPVGSVVSIAVFNNTTSNFSLPGLGAPVRVFTSSGDLVFAGFNQSNVSTNLAPGATLSRPAFDTTNSPPFGALGPGHYFVEAALAPAFGIDPPTVTGILTIGTPATPAPVFLFRYGEGFDVHGGATPSVMRVTNASASNQTLSGASATISVNGAAPTTPPTLLPPVMLAPGATAALGLNLGAIPANSTLDVVVTYNDPNAGPQSDLVEVAAPYRSDVMDEAIVHLPRGRVIPLGGFLPYIVQSRTLAPCVGSCVPMGAPIFMGNTIFYSAFALSPGSIALPGGGVLPLAFDSLLLASLGGGLRGALVGSPGTMVAISGLPRPGPVGGAFLIHPGPAFSGFVFYSAGIALTPGMPALGIQGSALRVLVLG